MLCNICNHREAEIHLEGIVNDKILKLHLCEDCAGKRGLEFNLVKQNFSLVDLLANLSDWEIPGHKTGNAVSCPECGLTYSQFKETGRLSCAGCYSAFALQLSPLLKRIHGSTKHTGKKPEVNSETAEYSLVKLKIELSEAVKNEDFERAAELRDNIKALKNGGPQ